MRVLVSGGSGRIGAELVPLLIARGWTVRLLQRGVTAPPPGARAGIEIVAGSIADPAIVRAAVADVDAICHLAARMPPATNGELFETNVRGTFNVLEAISDNAPRARLVYASTDATYGTGLSDRSYAIPIDEHVTPRPTNFYGATKVVGERVVLDYCRLNDLDFVTLRYCWVFRASEILELFSLATWYEFLSDSQRQELDELPDAVPVIIAADGEPFTDHVIDARDAALATAIALERTEVSGEAINVCGPAAFRYLDHSPRVARALGRPLVDLQLDGFHAYALDTTRAERLLGFRPRYDIAALLREQIPDYGTN